MIEKFLKPFSIVTNVVGYLILSYLLTRYFMRVSPQRSLLDMFTSVGYAVAILSAFSYTGTWVIVAKRNWKLFFKWFVAIDICPALIGLTAGIICN